MVQGDAYSMDVEITNLGEPLNIAGVGKVEISLAFLQKSYPDEVTYSDGKFRFPLTQAETFKLPPKCPMQVRVKFASGDVLGSEMQQVDVLRSISKVVI